MNTPSPGPGWSLASDGNWYPQRWEYYSQMWPCPWDGNLADTLGVVEDKASELGQQGWEMVNLAVVPEYSSGEGGKGLVTAAQAVTLMHNRSWLVTTMFKRPLAP
jgi:hypothetical protein